MSFTDRKPWTATKEDTEKAWCAVPNGERFRCGLCGIKFKAGDTVRWEYTNDVPKAQGNPLVCADCDGTREEILEKMTTVNIIKSHAGKLADGDMSALGGITKQLR